MSATLGWERAVMPAMGSSAEVIVGGGDPGLLEWALDEIAALERAWSRFRPDSELSALNECTGEWSEVSPATLLAVTRGIELHALTAGAFDLTVLDALERGGYDRTFELVRDDDTPWGTARDVDPAQPVRPDTAAIEVDLRASAVRLPPGVRIDLGGIGKGLAADLVAEGLVARGAATALVSIGGDMRAEGEPPDGGWPVPVEDPLDLGRTCFVEHLHRGALVTSTTRIRSWWRGGERVHHIVDPRSQGPSRSDVVAAVVADAAAWRAEGIAKAAVVAGRDEGSDLVVRAGARAWLLGPDGRVEEVGP